jgi:hypothetical protein
VAEQEIRADPHLRHVQPFDQHSPHERLGIPLRQLMREAHDRRALHAGLLESLELLRLGHDERRRLVRSHDPRRMRVERHDDGRCAAFAGDTPQPLEDLAVASMHPVEIAQREHRLRPLLRPRIVWKMNDFHVSICLSLDHHRPTARREAVAHTSARARDRASCA